MATHDYVIDNGSGASVRSDLNSVLAAIASNNGNATAPTTTYAYMWWCDTANALLKQRNGANTSWVNIGALDSSNLGLVLASSLGTAAYLNVGTSADNIVQLTAAAKLPAVDGSLLINLPASGTIPYGQIYGLLPTSISGGNTTGAVTISSGQAVDSTFAASMTTAGNTSWAVSNGNAINGYQGGTTLPNSSTIHFYICKGGTGTGTFASTSLTPTLPTGYSTYYRRIFSLLTNSSGALLAGTPVEVHGGAMTFWLATEVTDINGTTSSGTRTLYSMSVPSGVKMVYHGRSDPNSSSLGIIFSSPDEPDLTPSTGQSTAPGFDIFGGNGMVVPYVTTNTSGQIGIATGGGTAALYAYTRGWTDFRRA